MCKSVVIILGHGDLSNGFPRVTAQLWAPGHPLPEQFTGSLPPAPGLVELYRNWRSIYQNLCDRQYLRSQIVEEDDELEIDASGITNISTISFDDLCKRLETGVNDWLNSPEFLNIDQQMRSRLDTGEEIRVIIETNDSLLRRLPWHRWNFFGDYSQAEVALSRPEYKRTRQLEQKSPRNQVRILAIIGNSKGIDLEAEISFLNSLEDAEVCFLVSPSRQEFNTQLWHPAGWDILFFAGHSQSEGDAGRIYINENKTNNSLTIEQLEEALKGAIVQGLKLAIFNSCDGLGLASALEKLNIPTVITMREPVPNRVAQDFFNHFLEAFSLQRLPLYLSVQQARRKLQGLEDDFPGASWLPVICQNPAVKPPTWLCLGGMPPCPYRGLFAFREEDAHLFFGREQFTEELVAAVKKKPLVAIVGPSGSGKSSVVFAGLIPSLRMRMQAQTLIIVSFRPGNNPFEALSAALAPLPYTSQSFCKILESLVQKPSTRLVLIVDQFEELYTMTPESEREPFLDELLAACSRIPEFTLVITLRADFYGYALSHRPFSDALQGAVQNLGPMNREELRSAIEQPATQMQVQLEDGLTNELIDAVSGQPGHLPLLEFALTTLWSKQRDGILTWAAYKEIGGVEEALANHAETVYSKLSAEDRKRAQQVFVQLVQPGIGTDANRRLATRDEVNQENWDLVTRLASSRLVVTTRNDFTGEETVEIVHEALIRNWLRLGHWMRVDGEFRLWQEQNRAAIRQWDSSRRDEGALLRGKPLADAREWQSKRNSELSLGERSFIQLSWELEERKIKQQKRRRQITISSLIAGLVLALILAGVAWWQSQNSIRNEIKEIRSSTETLLASDREFDALIKALEASRKQNGIIAWGANFEEKVEIKKQVDSLLEEAIYKVRESNRLSGHEDAVKSVVFSPDGKTIATASNDKNIKLWNRYGKEIRTLKGHKGTVNSITFSPDGKALASGSADKTVKIWSLDGKEIQSFRGGDEVNSLAFSPDGRAIAFGSNDRTVRIWSLDGLENKILTGHSDRVTSVAFSRDGEIASGSWDNTVRLWNRDGKEIGILKGHNSWIWSVAFSPDGQTIATASKDNTVKLWSKDGREIKTFTGHSDHVRTVSFSPDGQVIASGSADKTVKLWSLDGSLLQTLMGKKDWVWSVSFSPDGKQIATASKDKIVKIWTLKGKEVEIIPAHKNAINSMSFSTVGKRIATASADKTVKFWSGDGKKLPQIIKGDDSEFTHINFSPDGKAVATATIDGTMKIWTLEGKLIKTFNSHKNSIGDVSFSPDSQIILIGNYDNQTATLFDRDGKLLQILKGHSDGVNSATFSPDGKTIVTASWDRTVKLWKKEGTQIKTFTGHQEGVNSATFSPDGEIIASASEDKTVKLWDVATGKEIKTLKGHEAGVYRVSFSPDGKQIASASFDKTVKLWDVATGKEIKTFKGHDAEVTDVTFGSNGHILASSDKAGKLILWNLDLRSDDLLKYGCNWVRDYLNTNSNVSESDRYLCDAP
jgi:WD40 repeat protein/energy-coupling factor transporter ATP-binding protein EcfA2